jgi:hypothetical protein
MNGIDHGKSKMMIQMKTIQLIGKEGVKWAPSGEYEKG